MTIVPYIHTGEILCCNYSPEGDVLATGAEDGKVIFWETGKYAKDPRYLFNAHDKAVSSVKFTPNGHFLLTSGREKLIKLWNVLDNYTRTTWLRSFTGHEHEIIKADISSDSEYVASICDQTLRIWNPIKATLIKRVRNVESGNKDLQFNPKGRYLAVGGICGLIQIYDCLRLTYSRIYDIKNEIFKISFHPSSQYLACSLRYFHHKKNIVVKVSILKN